MPKPERATYQRRVVDDEIAPLIGQLPDLAFEGAKAVGKPFTTSVRARTVWEMDDPGIRSIARAGLGVILTGDARYGSTSGTACPQYGTQSAGPSVAGRRQAAFL